MTIDLLATPFVHLVIDVQRRYLKKLSPQHRKAFQKKVGVFAREIRRRGIPTIWIAMDDNQFCMYSNSITRYKKRKTGFAIHKVYIGANESLLLKNRNSAFAGASRNAFIHPNLEDYLNRHHPGTKGILVSGMNTGACVVKTLLSGIDKSFDCYAVLGCLADSDIEKSNGALPSAEHRKRLVSQAEAYLACDDAFAGLDFPFVQSHLKSVSSANILNLLERKPALPSAESAGSHFISANL